MAACTHSNQRKGRLWSSRSHVANLRDISGGGAYIELQGPLNPAHAIAPDESVAVRFQLPGTTTELELKGRVARLDREAAGDRVVGLGVELLNVPAVARDLIEAYMLQQAGTPRG